MFMLTKTINQQAKSVVEVAINVPWEDIAGKWEATLQKMAAELELPGFRKGTAPLPMVEQNLGTKITDEFLKTAMPQALVEALQGSNIVPIDYPKYQAVSFTKGQPLSFKAVVTTRPQVQIGEYKNISVTRPQMKVTSDEEVNKVVEDLFKRWKVRQPSAVSNQPSAGGNTSSGSLSFNQSPAVPTTNGVSDQPDDNFAKALGAANLADLKTKVRSDLEAEAKYNNELDYEEAILQEVERLTSVEVPDVLVEDELNRMLVSLQRRVTDMGMLVEDYLKSQNETVESIKNKWRPQAEKNVRMELGLAEIGRLENVNITDEEVQSEIDKIQDARLKTQFEAQEPRLHLRHNLRQIRTLDLLKRVTKTT